MNFTGCGESQKSHAWFLKGRGFPAPPCSESEQLTARLEKPCPFRSDALAFCPSEINSLTADGTTQALGFSALPNRVGLAAELLVGFGQEEMGLARIRLDLNCFL